MSWPTTDSVIIIIDDCDCIDTFCCNNLTIGTNHERGRFTIRNIETFALREPLINNLCNSDIKGTNTDR